MGLRMLTKTTENTSYLEIIRGKRIHVKRVSPGPAHLDGEPHTSAANTEIELIPGSLRVIVGDYKSK